jgi:hypothetical protein
VARIGARLVAADDEYYAYEVGRCSRRSAHSVSCRLLLEGLDPSTNRPYICLNAVSVRFLSSSSYRIRYERRVIVCE